MIKCALIAMLLATTDTGVLSYLLSWQFQERKYVTIKSPEHSFDISIPRGWRVDQSEDVPDGFLAVAYPEGPTWRTSAVILLAAAYPKKDERLSLSSIISNDISDFRRGEPENRVLNARSLQTDDGKRARVKYFLGDSGEVNNATAYIDHGKVVVVLVMSTKNEDELYRSKMIFEQYVASYRRAKR